jgi:hypothetical protein
MFPLGPPSSKPSASQLATIFSWKTNIIQGTFWIVGFIEEGAVFLHSSDDKEATVEPTCFIVKGLGSKFSEMTMGLKSDYQIPYSLARTYLLPVNGKIVTCGQVATGETFHLPSFLLSESKTVMEKLTRCCNNSKVYFSLDAPVLNVKYLHTLRETYGECRERAFPRQWLALPKAKVGETSLLIIEDVWNSSRDMKYMTMDQCASTLKRPRNSLLYGYKASKSVCCGHVDAHTCRLCYSGRPFQNCCKQKHLDRVRRSTSMVAYCLSVMEPSVLDSNFNPIKNEYGMKLSLVTPIDVVFHFKSNEDLNEFKNRLYGSPMFSMLSEDEVMYFGYQVVIDQLGLQYFAKLNIFPNELIMRVECKSAVNTIATLKEINDYLSGQYTQPYLREIGCLRPEIRVSDIHGHLISKHEKEQQLNEIIDVLSNFCQGTPTVEVIKRKTLMSKCEFCGKEAYQCANQKLLICSQCRNSKYCSKEW